MKFAVSLSDTNPMKPRLRFLVFIATFFFTLSARGIAIQCPYLYDIQNKFLETHVLFSSANPTLQTRTVDQLIKSLDPNKMYFLEGDEQKIKRKTRRLFSNLKKRNCRALYDIYKIYKKRVDRQIAFALKYVQNNFKLVKNSSYNIDTENRPRPHDTNTANQIMRSYIQFQAANIYLVEEDLSKAVEYIVQNLKAQQTRVSSWKPHLTPRERSLCKKEQKKKNFKTCKPSKWFARYLNSFAQSLDSHSSYMDNEAIEEFKIHMELSLEGIGATLTSNLGYTVVEQLSPGGAASRSGQIKIKDKIMSVGQKKTNMINIFGLDLQDVVSLIRGPKGTPVYLKLMREMEDGKRQFFTIRLIRDIVNVQEEAVSLHFVKKKPQKREVAVIKVPSFYGSGRFGVRSVSRDVKKMLKKLRVRRASALVLDLSNNRGGSLDEAVTLSGFFFSKGNVVKQSEKRKSQHPNLLRDRDGSIFYKGPLVILVNRLSASASEIVSGALQNYNRAVIVGGQHTFGKGSVQSVDYLPFKLGAVKTTVGLYFIPNGHSTQNEGVASDIVFPSLLTLEDLGEKSLDYALPKKEIPPFLSSPEELFSANPNKNWNPLTPHIIAHLKKLSEERVKKSEKFKKIKKKLAGLQEKTKEKKPVTVMEILNNEDKVSDKKKEDDLDDLKDKKIAKEKKYLQRADVEEAVNIALDLSLLEKTRNIKAKKSHPLNSI